MTDAEYKAWLDALQPGDSVLVQQCFAWGPIDPQVRPRLAVVESRTAARAKLSGGKMLDLRSGVVTPRYLDYIMRAYPVEAAP